MALGGCAADGTSELAGDKGMQKPACSSPQHQLSKEREHHPAASLMSIPAFQPNWADVAWIRPMAVRTRKSHGLLSGRGIRSKAASLNRAATSLLRSDASRRQIPLRCRRCIRHGQEGGRRRRGTVREQTLRLLLPLSFTHNRHSISS